MGKKIAEITEAQREHIIELRKAVHRHPELGNNEYRTAELIEKRLCECGIKAVRMLDTAVIGRLDGGLPGRTVALRADMDALPLTENTGADFASLIPGVMHACGHDVHTAALAGAAEMLASCREDLKGNVVFIFQPDEEGSGGAERLIRAGCLENVDAVFGAHVSPELPEGHIGVRYGKFYAASDVFRVRVYGKSSHGAVRRDGIDALEAACAMVTELLSLPAKVTADQCVLTVGRLSAGTAVNILPGYAEFEGIIRTLGPETRKAMEDSFREVVSRISPETGTCTEIEYTHSYPGVVNDDDMTEKVRTSAARLLGAEKVHIIEEATMTTEDFGYYLDEVPGAFFHIGAGCSEPLHSDAFLPSEAAACELAAILARITLDYLS